MKPIQFKVGTTTVIIANPEAIPTARRKIAELIMEMARKEIEKESIKERI